MSEMSSPGRESARGVPLWGKIALGCLTVVVVGTATCVGASYLVFEKGGDLIRNMAKENWTEVRDAVDLMMTDEGARKLYRSHPGLEESFPTEDRFLEAVKKWRPELEPVPEKIPILQGEFNLAKQHSHGKPRTELSYTNGKEARLTFTWENGALIDIDVRR
jgi:hypothetical protein